MKKYTFLLTAIAALSTVPGLARATDAYLDSNGVKIRYVTEGEGEAIVLIHGWMSDSSMWGQDAAGNTKLDATPVPGFQVIALDCRGHGKSDKPHDKGKYGAEMAGDVVRLLDHLKIKRAHLVGYSMGAFIAGKVAATHPERVLSVIYGGQAPLIVGEKSSGPNEVDVFAKAVEEGKGLGPYILAVVPPDKPKPTLEQANAIAKFLYGGKDVKAFVAAGRSLGELEVTAADLAKCKVPSLFIFGEKEPASLRDRIAAIRKVISDSQVIIIDGADHVTTLAKPKFGSSVVEFLRAHKSKGDGR